MIPNTIENILTYTNCFVRLDVLKTELAGEGFDFTVLEQRLDAAMKYFCSKELFNDFHYQGSLVPMYELFEGSVGEVVAIAIPVNGYKMICESVKTKDYLPRKSGIIKRQGMKLVGVSGLPKQVMVPITDEYFDFGD